MKVILFLFWYDKAILYILHSSGTTTILSRMQYYSNNEADVQSINYDFLPTIHQMEKVLWVQLRYQPPKTLYPGKVVKLVSLNHNLNIPNQKFEVIDVVGTRVVLKSPSTGEEIIHNLKSFVPLNQKDVSHNTARWHPLHHNYHWGYSSKDKVDTLDQYRNWTYGSGVAVAKMVW